MPKFCQKKI